MSSLNVPLQCHHALNLHESWTSNTSSRMFRKRLGAFWKTKIWLCKSACLFNYVCHDEVAEASKVEALFKLCVYMQHESNCGRLVTYI